ncbi:uncharacterized protein MONOS_11776 [Monocercomonoides exilis]|uniref:uncharacterized protein n=1 Tax=Monocercomonoides exilis TaxID=2049356 RepID=UPI003559DCB1|nr:hypothetical protein MONOS_11776 [Monocercomonoides exilis]|eukprot:MONOS_11776.1-p1 / transcript=MONOS_11776.1 / gene=MONOS_11776 / organism=Monocercomonoides_exilis_PA203 / gene_product=unspecified product / transcript_product=unspecified product / location=Mono_scaffold00610:7971-8168(+) / protein_length=66 / sequence_SO=supercontig / SO=protein_coding / is_pseudo=false
MGRYSDTTLEVAKGVFNKKDLKQIELNLNEAYSNPFIDIVHKYRDSSASASSSSVPSDPSAMDIE